MNNVVLVCATKLYNWQLLGLLPYLPPIVSYPGIELTCITVKYVLKGVIT